VNYGVRYEIQRAQTERYNSLAYFDPALANPIGSSVGMPGLKGGIRYVDDKNRTPYDTSYGNFAPRVGLAYRIRDSFVVRAGYGITYLKTVTTYLTYPSNDGFSYTTPWVSTLDGGRTVANYWVNSFPQGIANPPGSKNGAMTQVGLAVSEFMRGRPTPYMQSYSLDLQYQFHRNTVVELGYAGTQGRKLLAPTFELNQLPDNLLSMGNALLANVTNPFYGQITSGTLAGPMVQRGQLLRPYPQYTSVGLLVPPMSSSSFNAMTAKLTHRFSKGLAVMASYQFSKAMDNISEDGAGRIRNFNNLSLERSISGHDFPHSLLLTFGYDLPVGKGKALGGSVPGALDAVIGGWSISGIYSYTSGVPLNYAVSSNNTNSFGGNQYPNIADRKLIAISNRSRYAWFNTAAFSQPAAFTFGNAPRYVAEVRTDPTNNVDLSISKTFPIREKLKLQFRAETYNTFNHNQFAAPVTTFASTTFGQITSSRSTPRNVQLALRLSF